MAKTALAEITNEMVNVSYTPKTRSELSAVFDKRLSTAESFVIGAPGDAHPVRRVTYDIVESDASTRILASLSIVRNPGAGNGRPETASVQNTSSESLLWQQLLDKVKSRLEKK